MFSTNTDAETIPLDAGNVSSVWQMAPGDRIFWTLALPDVDGYEVASRVRTRAELRDVKLIALTGWG